MYNSGTIFGSDKVTRNDTESTFTRIYPGNELFILQSYKIRTFAMIYNFIFIFTHYRKQQIFGQYQTDLFFGVGIMSFDEHIVDIGTYSQSCIRRQCPGSGSPGQKICVVFVFQFKLRNAGGIFHIAVTARLVQLVRAKTGSGSG